MAKETAPKKKTKRPTPEKRNLQNQKRRMQNKVFRSSLRTSIKHFQESATKTEGKESAQDRLNEAFSQLDKAAKRGVIKKNAASRKKARLAAQFAKQSS